jgi:hypothetical protein
LGKRVEGEMVVTHVYHILDTCKFTLEIKFSLSWKMGKLRGKYWENVT